MTTDHDSLLDDWKRNSKRLDGKNFRFLRSLKMVDDPEEIDEIAHELHHEIFNEIECVRCANCCKTMRPGFNDEDIDRIAGRLGMTRDAFVSMYLEAAEFGDFQTRTAPCPFLGKDDRCTIYSDRPKSCREFPHTDKVGFSTRSYLLAENALVCPAVFHILGRMRRRLK